uniref:Cilia- and flagella-associated protein 299 n=1 Tax=Sphenodon punctatus TaxID=8508 RepID=A0A8D0L344_SPHPU
GEGRVEEVGLEERFEGTKGGGEADVDRRGGLLGRRDKGDYNSIIFIRDRNSRGQEVSAYIDYAHRLKSDEFEVYFTENRSPHYDLLDRILGDNTTRTAIETDLYIQVVIYDHILRRKL